jgi:5-methylcytosine-specific restriction endonuclease McrA
MDNALRRFVRQRANGHCEYCRLAQESEPLPFHVEHIIARQHEGGDSAENLAVACNHCNLHKGPNLSGIDPETRQTVQLFHPRTAKWDQHFASEAGIIIGLTPVGRATVRLLKMNAMGRVQLRREQ